MRLCEKCGHAENYGDVERWRLAGAYYAYLCVPCVNAWTETQRSKTKKIDLLIAMKLAAIQGGDCGLAGSYESKIHAEQGRLFAATKAWVGRSAKRKTGKGQ